MSLRLALVVTLKHPGSDQCGGYDSDEAFHFQSFLPAPLEA